MVRDYVRCVACDGTGLQSAYWYTTSGAPVGYQQRCGDCNGQGILHKIDESESRPSLLWGAYGFGFVSGAAFAVIVMVAVALLR